MTYVIYKKNYKWSDIILDSWLILALNDNKNITKGFIEWTVKLNHGGQGSRYC